MGFSLIVVTPRQRLPKIGVAALFVLASAPLAALLPAEWLGGMPEWRTRLVSEWSLHLGKAVTPQPAVTIEAWLVMICGLFWLWGCLGQGFNESQRRLAMRCLTLGGGLFAGLSMLEHWNHIEISWWPRDERSWGGGFGPFANRNHISSLCAVTAVLAAAVAHDSFRRRSRWWIAALLAFGACLGAILVNTSRGGLLLFFVGMTLWLATSAMHRGFIRNAAIWVSIIIATGSIVLVSGGNLSQRLKSGIRLENLGADFRVLLFRDAIRMTADAPVTGTGLGNFSAVFPQTTTMDQPALRFLHPESDVLWFLVEGGLLSFVPLLFLAGWLTTMSGPWRSRGEKRSRADRRLRRAAGVAALVAMLHSFVDVPMHGIAYFMVAGLLIGLAVRPASLGAAGGWVHRWAFRLGGLVVGGLGICWIGIAQDRLEPPVASTARQLHRQALKKTRDRQPAAAMVLVERALKLTPLEYGLHHMRAQLRLQLGQSSQRALHDFGLARAIEPNVANFCYWEGSYWLAYDPILATVPWREWVRRSRGRAESLWGGYRQMVLDAEPFPEVISTLRQMAVTPAMKLIFLMAAKPGPEWQKCLDQLLAEQPNLEVFDAEQSQHLFAVWDRVGDRQALISALESHPAWQVHGWRILAGEYVRRGDFQKAYQIAAKHQPQRVRPPPVSGASIETLRRELVLKPNDPRPGIELFYALQAKGEREEALYALQKVSQMPSAPVYVKQELAALLAEKGDYRGAWEWLMAAADKGK
ncbi:MAG TPA: O-antigen ligase family protein [Prosthecobacter sp.]|nr:O-antigen ligase family protein [Prosthecobacter sp.]